MKASERGKEQETIKCGDGNDAEKEKSMPRARSSDGMVFINAKPSNPAKSMNESN